MNALVKWPRVYVEFDMRWGDTNRRWKG